MAFIASFVQVFVGPVFTKICIVIAVGSWED